jgi:hypothetical protein
MLFPGHADEDEEPRLFCQIEQPPRRDTVRPGGIDPVGAHRREVGRDRRRRRVLAAVITTAERLVRDTPEGELPLPRPDEFAVRLRLLQCLSPAAVWFHAAAAQKTLSALYVASRRMYKRAYSLLTRRSSLLSAGPVLTPVQVSAWRLHSPREGGRPRGWHR